MAVGVARRPRRRGRPQHRPARAGDGPPAGRPRRPAAGQRPLRGQVLDAGDDGHRPQPRPQRRSRRRAWPRSDRRRALRLRLLPALHRHVRPHRARHRRRAVRQASSRRPRRRPGVDHRRRGAGRRPAASCATAYKAHGQGRRPASPSRRTRSASCAAPSRPCSARGTAPGPSPTATASSIPHDLGTAVNVQAMVFGNRDDSSGTGVGFTRDPATGEAEPYGDFLVNAQGEDVVAGIRNTARPRPAGRAVPEHPRRAAGIFDRLEAHYRDMCDTEFTIEQGKLWMLQTRVGKRTGRAALRMAVDMTQQTRRKGWRSPATRPCCGSPRTTSTRCCTPSSRRARAARSLATGPGRLAGRRGGQAAYFTADAAAEAAEPGRAGHARAHRDVARGRARHAGRPRASSPPGAAWSATPPSWPAGWGIPAVVGAEAVRIAGTSFTVGDVTVSRGRRDLPRRHHRRGRRSARPS